MEVKTKGTHQAVRRAWDEVKSIYLISGLTYKQKLSLFKRMVLILTMLRDPRTKRLGVLIAAMGDILNLLSIPEPEAGEVVKAFEALDSAIDSVLLAASARRRSFTIIPSVISLEEKDYGDYTGEEEPESKAEEEEIPDFRVVDEREVIDLGSSSSDMSEKAISARDVVLEKAEGEETEADEGIEGGKSKPTVNEEESATSAPLSRPVSTVSLGSGGDWADETGETVEGDATPKEKQAAEEGEQGKTADKEALLDESGKTADAEGAEKPGEAADGQVQAKAENQDQQGEPKASEEMGQKTATEGAEAGEPKLAPGEGEPNDPGAGHTGDKTEGPVDGAEPAGGNDTGASAPSAKTGSKKSGDAKQVTPTNSKEAGKPSGKSGKRKTSGKSSDKGRKTSGRDSKKSVEVSSTKNGPRQSKKLSEAATEPTKASNAAVADNS